MLYPGKRLKWCANSQSPHFIATKTFSSRNQHIFFNKILLNFLFFFYSNLISDMDSNKLHLLPDKALIFKGNIYKVYFRSCNTQNLKTPILFIFTVCFVYEPGTCTEKQRLHRFLGIIYFSPTYTGFIPSS